LLKGFDDMRNDDFAWCVTKRTSLGLGERGSNSSAYDNIVRRFRTWAFGKIWLKVISDEFKSFHRLKRLNFKNCRAKLNEEDNAFGKFLKLFNSMHHKDYKLA
jgi:hypothetical protein